MLDARVYSHFLCVLGMHKFVVPHMKLTTFFWLSWEQCICHPCSFYAGCLACYMLHFNGKNLISERSLKLVPLHTTIPTKGITNESQWSRSCQELPTDTATHPWPKKIWFWEFKTGDFQLSQLSGFFPENSRDWSLENMINWCKGHQCDSTYMVVRLSDVSSKKG